VDDELLFRVRDLVGSDPRRRDAAIDDVIASADSFEESEAELLMHLLAVVAVQEEEPALQEGELEALVILRESHPVRPGVLATLAWLNGDALTQPAAEARRALMTGG
jgi:flavin-binding protein dodecin